MEDIETCIPLSPSTHKLYILEKELDLERKRNSFMCCSGSDISKELIHYSVGVGFGFTMLGFSIYNLVSENKYHDLSISMISMLVGVFLPTPKIKEQK